MLKFLFYLFTVAENQLRHHKPSKAESQVGGTSVNPRWPLGALSLVFVGIQKNKNVNLTFKHRKKFKVCRTSHFKVLSLAVV